MTCAHDVAERLCEWLVVPAGWDPTLAFLGVVLFGFWTAWSILR